MVTPVFIAQILAVYGALALMFASVYRVGTLVERCDASANDSRLPSPDPAEQLSEHVREACQQ